MSFPSQDDISDDEPEDTMFPVPRYSRPVIPIAFSPSPRPLEWTRQLHVYLVPDDASDKILLPPTALEQLLSSNPHNTDLPQPLTFRIFNPKNNHFTHVGVREFSAPNESIGIPSWICHTLDLQNDDLLTISFRVLPKATRVKLRPLEAGYIEDDWKALLESQLRTHTTLTKGEILAISAGPMTTFRFLIDELEPEDAVNLIDTDVTTEIEEMSEDNARLTQTQRIKAAKLRNTEVTDVRIGQSVSGSVGEGEYLYFRLREWDRRGNLEVGLKGEGDADLVVSTSEDWKPKVDMHLWSDMSGEATKRVAIAGSNVELHDAAILQVGIHGSTDATFEISIRQPMDISTSSSVEEKPNAHAPGFTECQNCLSWVPERSLVLHQNFCLRNNFRCPECNTVLPKKEQSSHWHCPDCSAHGKTPTSFEKHRTIEHTPHTCPCGQPFQSLPALASHRATSCPQKIIKCRYCQTFNPQGDLSTLSPADILANLTPHEADCGSRTIECPICTRRLRIKDLPIHNQLHDNERKARPEPRNCRNANCTRPRSENPLGLCTLCFGPLYSPLHDPGYRKLQARLERRLLGQLMTGCQRSYCGNTPYCATALGRAVTMREGMGVVRGQVEGMMNEDLQFRICVDESVQRRAFLAGMIGSEGVYGIEWCRRAVEEGRGDLTKARNWLEINGRRRNE